MKRLRTLMFVAAVFLALLLSAMIAVPALADDGLPPAEETPPAEEMTGETEPPAQEGEALPPAEETDPASEEQAPPVESILEGLPEDTQLIVVDEEGEALPLASQEAQEAISTGDPMWCPVGVTPGAASCSPSYTRFNDPGTPEVIDSLIEWLKANPKAVAGVIWIETSYVGTPALEGAAVILNGNDYTSMGNYALTLNGGWLGCTPTCVSTLDPNAPSTFSVSLWIAGWNAPITIKNILIEGAGGAVGDALSLGTTGNINLNNVDVLNNQFGAWLDNTGGTGNIIVNDSSFNGNWGLTATGLIIYTKGTISVRNLNANDNATDGVRLDNTSSATPKAVTLSGSNNFNSNGWNGLGIYSNGAITLNNVTAIYNTGGSGVLLDNCNYNTSGQYCNTYFGSNVIIKGANNFSNNGWDGLRVFSGGAITVGNITANGNGTDPIRPGANFPGWQLYNAYGKGVFLHNYGSWTPKPVTLTGTNTFNGNASTGLFVLSWGAIKASNLTANENGCDTLKDTDPHFCAGVYLDGKGVILSGAATFLGNARDGLLAYSYNAPISLSFIYAKDNGEHGALLYTYGSAAANITVAGTNVFLDNGEVGLLVVSTGIVTLNNLTASGNGTEGVYVDNQDAATPKAVAIKGTNVFNGNGYGLVVYSYGAIVTNNITALYNEYGVYLNNCWNSGGSCTAYSPQPVTLTGLNNVSYNNIHGLEIRSSGAITVANITADFNLGGFGAYLDNWWDNARGGVTITGYGSFSNNGDFHGLTVWSTGAVVLANLTANGNARSGVIINNYFSSAAPANVTITGTNFFNGNNWSGLDIETYGAVLLNNITANDNGTTDDHAGVLVDNHLGTLSRPVTLNGVNIFNGNYGTGLNISSLGAIRVNMVTANNNGLNGAILDNQWNQFTSPLTVAGYGIFNGNAGGYGLQVHSNGSVTTSNIAANDNGVDGMLIRNFSIPAQAAASVNVTMLGVNTFNGNIEYGLRIRSDGLITLNNITANDNGKTGAHLDNVSFGSVLKNIALNGTNTFVNNALDGLFFNASGSVFLTRVTAALNNDTIGGAPLSAGIFGTAGGNITLTCGNLFLNEGSGYFLSSGGVITLKGVFSYANGDADSALGTSVLITRTCPLP